MRLSREPRCDVYDAIIVGAGMGGLSAAAYLAGTGRRVCVIEQHYRAGGYAHSFRRRKYLFDSAVRIVAGAKHGLLSRLLETAGVGENLEFIPLPEAYVAHYPHLTVHVPATLSGFIDAHIRLFPHEAVNLRALVAEMCALYRAVLGTLDTGGSALLANPYITKYYQMPFVDMIRAFIADKQAASVLCSLWPYFGCPPALGSALFFSYAIMSYFIEGIYYVRGSFQNLADAYVRVIEKHGGEVCISNRVERIRVDRGAARGVDVTHGGAICAPLVISNAAALVTAQLLSDRRALGLRYLRRMERLSVSLSAFEVFIGTDMPLSSEQLGHETFLFDSFDHDGGFAAHQQLGVQGPAGIRGLSVSTPTLVDSSLAPSGHHTLVLTTLAPYDLGVPWSGVKESYTERLVTFAERIIPGLSSRIRHLEAGSPMTMQRYTENSFGSPYGWEQSITQRRLPHQTPIDGLYLVGHWTEPGAGVVSVLLSGYQLARKLLGGEIPRLDIDSFQFAGSAV